MRNLFFLFFLLPLFASAQPASDGYVHDVIYPLQLNDEANKNFFWDAVGQVANYKVSAYVVTEFDTNKGTYTTQSCYLSKDNTIPIEDAPVDPNAYNGIVVTRSQGIPRSVTINYSRKQDEVGFFVYCKDTPFTNTEELYSLANESAQKTLLFSESTSATINLEGDASYIGFKPSGKVNIKSIDIAWQQTSYSRPGLEDGDLGTLCLPYSASTFSGFTPYTIKGKTLDSNGTLESIVFEEAQTLEAGKPYVFVANGTELSIELSGETAITTPSNNNGLYGTFVDYPFAQDSNFNEADRDYLVINADNCLQAASKQSGVRANRAFIKVKDIPELNAANSAPRQLVLTADGYQIDGQGPTSAVSSGVLTNAHSGNVYTPDGRKAAKATTPNLSISNGRKELRTATNR